VGDPKGEGASSLLALMMALSPSSCPFLSASVPPDAPRIRSYARRAPCLEFEAATDARLEVHTSTPTHPSSSSTLGPPTLPTTTPPEIPFSLVFLPIRKPSIVPAFKAFREREPCSSLKVSSLASLHSLDRFPQDTSLVPARLKYSSGSGFLFLLPHASTSHEVSNRGFVSPSLALITLFFCSIPIFLQGNLTCNSHTHPSSPASIVEFPEYLLHLPLLHIFLTALAQLD